MFSNLLATVFEPRYPRGYVGRHRAPRLHYVGAIRIPARSPAPMPATTPVAVEVPKQLARSAPATRGATARYQPVSSG